MTTEAMERIVIADIPKSRLREITPLTVSVGTHGVLLEELPYQVFIGVDEWEPLKKHLDEIFARYAQEKVA